MATKKRVMGALPERIDVRDYKFKKTPFRSANYPSHFECPIQTEIKDQGSVGSCVAMATAEILEYHYPETKMSTNFIYGIHYKLYGSRGPGMWLRTRCKVVTKYGDPLYEFCKGNTEVEKVYEIAEKAFCDSEAMVNAKEHKISKYVRVVTTSDIKYSLMEYGPIMGAIMWYDENKFNKQTNILEKGKTLDGGHAIVVRGWTEDGWICQNSWGKN